VKKHLVLLCTAFVLYGCASITPVGVDVVIKNSATFVLGQTQEKNAGEALVVEASLRFYEAPVAVNEYQPPSQMGTTYPPIRPGMVFKPYGRLKNGDVLYTSPSLVPMTMYGKAADWAYCIAVNAQGAAYGDAACGIGLVRTWKDAPENIVETRPVFREGSVKRELVYNGRSGNSVKIIYREYRYNFSAPALTQELAYDLTEGAVIRFRKMEIEVLSASSSSIKYIVRSTMDGATTMQGVSVEPDAGTTRGVFSDI